MIFLKFTWEYHLFADVIELKIGRYKLSDLPNSLDELISRENDDVRVW